MSAGIHTGCDRALALAEPTTARGAPATPHPRLLLAATVLASSLAMIDGSVVNVGLPTIGRAFAANGASLSWVINGYLLPLSALLLIGGALGDRFGRRRALMIGVGIFAAASILCAVAPTLSWLLAGRVLQGIGAAVLMPNSLAILGASFSGEARGRAIGTWAAVGAAAGAIGPLLGGWLIDTVSWRAIFAINLPIAAAALFMAARYVANEAGAEAPPLDLGGAALATLGLSGLTWTLTIASGPSGMGATGLPALAIGTGSILGFLAVERRKGDRAMTPLALFGSREFVGLTLLTFLLYAALGAILVLVPFVLIESSGHSATAAGAALLPLPLIIAVSSPMLGGFAAKVGSRLPLSLGPAVVAGGCVLATRIGSGGSYWTTTLPAVAVIAVGMAGAVAPLTTAVLSSVERRHTGVASGLNSAVARTGGLVATALLSSVLATRGAPLLALFRIALIVCAAASLAAGASAWLLLAPGVRDPSASGSR